MRLFSCSVCTIAHCNFSCKRCYTLLHLRAFVLPRKLFFQPRGHWRGSSKHAVNCVVVASSFCCDVGKHDDNSTAQHPQTCNNKPFHLLLLFVSVCVYNTLVGTVCQCPSFSFHAWVTGLWVGKRTRIAASYASFSSFTFASKSRKSSATHSVVAYQSAMKRTL